MNNSSGRSPDDHTPLVSIICLTCNHEAWLARALDGFLNQTIAAETEILVHDDASTDSTTEILLSYAGRWPGVIQPIIREKNLHSQGVSLYDVYTRHVFSRARGKYLAVCEGDDYWTDPRKLERQVDFLENHPGYTVCFHHAGIQHGASIDPEEHHRNTGFELFRRVEYSLEDLLLGNFILNCTVVYRNLHLPYPELFGRLLLPDWPLHLFHARHGKIKFLPEMMAVHRVHDAGLWNGLSRGEQAFHARMTLECFMKFLDDPMNPVIRKTMAQYEEK